MANIVIVGMQWGDEGKGKIVDLVCPAFDVVVRYQGGHNAGHTVKFADRHFSLHLIPSGILHEGMRAVLGNGMVIAPEALFKELDGLAEAGIDWQGRLVVSSRAHTILPWHAELDRAREAARGDKAIGTTSRGIGPAYESKASRYGIRLAELGGGDALADRLGPLHLKVAAELAALGAPEPTPVDQVLELCATWAERLAPLLADTELELSGLADGGASILFEGAQGALLDLDHGTYPYVTSSSSTAGGAATGTGLAPQRLDSAVGVLKAYTTRVGAGPFPTELEGSVGDHLRARGNEFGTTTGRPRRCGWLDLVVARYARRLSGIETIALTKLDVLDELEEIRICSSYRLPGGEVVRDLPADPALFAAAEPIYEALPGWQSDTVGSLALADLPSAARSYIDRVEDEVGAKIELVSTGPRREETILLADGPFAGHLGDRFATVLDLRGS
jgi:adenylosuccinate synthase